MQWAILAIVVLFVIFSWVIIQGTRAAIAYRKAASAGDVDVIRQVLEESVSAWCSIKRPKEVAPDVWRGVQSMQLLDVGPDYARVGLTAESEYKLVEGRWVEVASPLEAGMAITARAADMLLYELPHVKLGSAQIDVYTTFRDTSGESSRSCILSTIAGRESAREVDWDGWSARDIVEALGGRYRLGDAGQALPIDPDEVTVSAGERAEATG
ncbi:MAG: hypothetical protein HYS09_00945 [Chloroflexi bacterium]|nr:hypothetical protein [Chloroflexota bacterium]